MLYPQEIIEEVRGLNDIADVIGGYVTLQPKGGRLFGLCPFHNEKTASFSVNPEQQMFYCFGCQAGGNVISFIMQIENFDFMDALKLLADRVRFTLPQPSQTDAVRSKIRARESIAEINKKAARFFYDRLQEENDEAKAARVYLDTRGVHPKIRTKFGLGLSPAGWDGLCKYLTGLDYPLSRVTEAGLAVSGKTGHYDRFRGRLMFPIFDITGQVIGFGGRVLTEGEPKYLNSPETPLFDKSRHLYGLNLARKAKSKEIVLVEGYMDVISLHQAGFTHAAGILGTALSAEHARLLKRTRYESALLLLDSDEAGTQAALKAIPILLAGGLKVRVLQVTDAKDPDEFLRRYGPERFARALREARSHVAFRVGLLRQRFSLDSTEGRVAFTQEAAALLATLQSAVETDAYGKEIAAMTGIAPEAIRAEVARQRGTQADRSTPGLRGRPMNRTPKNEKGLRDARKGLISLLFAHPAAGRALYDSGLLPPEEMGDPVAGRLLAIAYESAAAGRLTQPADALNRFEELPEQRQAAEMLQNTLTYETVSETEKALNEMCVVIKRAWLSERMFQAKTGGEADLAAVQSLSETVRNLPAYYITLPPREA